MKKQNHEILTALHCKPLYNINRSEIWGKKIQTAGYNGVCTVFYFSLIDAKLYIHAKDQFLDFSGRMGYKVFLGKRFECQVTVQEIIQLEYRNVKNALALSSKDKTCSYQVYDECMYNTMYEYSFDILFQN